MAALLNGVEEEGRYLELAARLGSVGHWRISLPDHTITWSAEIYHIHGVTPAEYTPDLTSAIDFYHPDDREIVLAAIAAAIEHGAPFEFALRLIRPDGALRHVASRGLIIKGPDQKPSQIFGVFVDMTEQRNTEAILREANHELERIAYVDALTGLANRRHFDEVLDREWRRAQRDRSAFSLAILDIDRFKSFNDQYGHVAGDDCLRKVAAALTAAIRRPGDLVARYGGEEFALILPATDAAGAHALADTVREVIANLAVPHEGNITNGHTVTASFGVATADHQTAETLKTLPDLIIEADCLLYEAKRTGRNRVVSQRSLPDPRETPIPPNEEARLEAFTTYQQAGALERCAELDRIARLAATLTAMPIALVSLIGRNEQHFAGNHGLETLTGTARKVAFCAHTIMGTDPFVVPDAATDPRFTENPFVTGDLGLRYYAGAPIVSETTGQPLGALCILDTAPHTETSPAQRAILADLATMVANFLEQKKREPAAPRTASRAGAR